MSPKVTSMSRSPRHRQPLGRLTQDQQARAAQYVPLALSLARAQADVWPGLAEELESAAQWALCRAARTWRQCLGAWPSYARNVITTELRKVIDSSSRRLIEHQLAQEPIDRRQPGDQIESEDEFRELLRTLDRNHRAVLWYLFVDGTTLEEAGRRLGYSASHAMTLRDEGFQIIRERLQPGAHHGVGAAA